MSFIEQLRNPSFRGFEFSLSSEDKSFGRDVKKHKVINANTIYYEDVGILERAFTVEAVIGGTEDFINQANAFEDILSQKGPGQLILPHTEEMNVIVTSARRRTTDREVGLVYFSITFEQTEEDQPVNKRYISQIDSAASDSFDAGIVDFSSIYKAGVPDFVNNTVLGNLGNLETALQTSLTKLGMEFEFPEFSLGDTSLFAGEIVNTLKAITSGYTKPVNYSISFNPIENKALPPALDVVGVLEKNALTFIEADSLSTNTSSQSLRTINTKAVDMLSRVAVISEAARAVSFSEFESKQQALLTRQTLLETMGGIRKEAGEEGWNKSYMALGTLMSAVNRDIDEVLGRLPQTVTIHSQNLRPSLALAYRLYGDNHERVIPMAADIVKRNMVIHPSFVPADDLEVIADV